MTRKLELQATWNHDPLPASEQTSLTYLLVDIKAEEAGMDSLSLGEGAGPLNLSLVLDTSGSMAGAKLQNLKKAVSQVIDMLRAEDTVAITLFSDEVHPLTGSRVVGEDRKALHGQIEEIKEAGGTAISKGLEVGLAEARKGQRAASVSRILLLTDGQTWGDADACKELAKEAGKAGVPITALGVGADEDWSIELLDAIAGASGGLSDYISKPEEIGQAFEGTLSAMQSTLARNLRLTFNPAQGVSARAVYRAAPVIAKLWPADGMESDAPAQQTEGDGSETVTLPVGEIGSAGGQTLLYEVVLPARRAGQYRLARLSLDYEVGESHENSTLDLVVKFTPDAGKGPGDARVMNSVEKTTTFKLQTRALQASMVGDKAAATRNLRAVATRLLNMGETELAEAAEQEAVRVEREGQMSPAGTKKLVFDTRKLALSETNATRAATVKLDEDA